MNTPKNIARHSVVPHGGPYSVKNPSPKLIDFSSNVNPLGCPTPRKLLKNWIKKIPVYPDPNSTLLKKRLASYLGVSEANIVVGNGATEVIYNFCRAAIEKNRVLIPIPTFGEYEAAARLCGGKLEFFETMNLENDLTQFIRRLPRHGVVFICNPNNPTGALVPRKSMNKVIKAAKTRDALVFVDECFMELTQVPQSVTNQVTSHDNLFVLRSLTKSFGLAGLRIGYGVGNKKLVTSLNKIKIPWNVSSLAQEAAAAAILDKRFIAKSRNLIRKESAFLKNSISKLDGFCCLDTTTNFMLIKTKMHSKILQKKLLQKEILVRDCSTFRGLGQNYIRIAVKTHKENLKLVKELEALS